MNAIFQNNDIDGLTPEFVMKYQARAIVGIKKHKIVPRESWFNNKKKRNDALGDSITFILLKPDKSLLKEQLVKIIARCEKIHIKRKKGNEIQIILGDKLLSEHQANIFMQNEGFDNFEEFKKIWKYNEVKGIVMFWDEIKEY